MTYTATCELAQKVDEMKVRLERFEKVVESGIASYLTSAPKILQALKIASKAPSNNSYEFILLIDTVLGEYMATMDALIEARKL